MSKELKHLGEMFQVKRKELNLSLKEVENVTSIRTNHLEAIEEGTINDQVASVYAQGFTRQYGSFLGIDIDRIMRDNPEVFQGEAQKHDFTYGIGTLEVRGSLGGGVKWMPSLIWSGISATVLVLAWYLAKFLGVL
jgi:cytoskeletal protein RodZ